MIVLDTNVVSEAMRPQPDPNVLAWLNAQPAEALYLTSMTFAELLFGISVLPLGARKDHVERALDALLAGFVGRILPFDAEAARRYAAMASVAKELGRTLPLNDGYLAATASANGFAVATRNTKDFAVTTVALINPWQPA